MTDDDGADGEELAQPPRRRGTALLTTIAGAAVVGAVLLGVHKDDEPTPTAAPTPTPSSSVPLSVAESSPVFATISPSEPLLQAVAAAYPGAELVEFGAEVPFGAGSDRNYQLLSGRRRITVVVGPEDARPEVQTSSPRDVLVVAKRSGHRVAVSVRTFRGTLRPTDTTRVRRLVEDTRLLATS